MTSMSGSAGAFWHLPWPLEHSLLERSHHAVRKPKQPPGEASMEGSQGLWLRAAVEVPAYSQH